MISPAPLKTILSPERYPFAVAMVENDRIVYTVGYANNLEDCYAQVQGWRSARPNEKWIMAEMKEIGKAIPNVCVNTYWVAV